MKYEFVKFGYSTIGMSDHGIHNNNNNIYMYTIRQSNCSAKAFGTG